MNIGDLDVDPARVVIGGRLHYKWPSGRTFPVIQGGDGPDDPPTDPPEGWTPPASQEELDRIIEDRLNRDRKARKPAVDDTELEELRRKAGEFDKLEAENQTELEREKTLRQAAEARLTQVENESKRTKIEAALVAAASGKAVDPAVVAQLILGDPNNAVTIDDAGQVTGADTAVTTLLESKPYLAQKVGTPPPMGQGRNRDGDPGKPSGIAAGYELHKQRNPQSTH